MKDNATGSDEMEKMLFFALSSVAVQNFCSSSVVVARCAPMPLYEVKVIQE